MTDQPHTSRDKRLRWLAPEVIQTSAMDCGPATLKCLLEGSGISVSYGRLREACQTDVDGTSINTMEEVAQQLGLQAEQVMVPLDHLLSDHRRNLPAIVVVRLPNGVTHFVVAWRRHGAFVQLMDPGNGRRWVSLQRFLGDVYVHRMPVPAAGWREWAGSAEFLEALGRRMAELGLEQATAQEFIQRALGDQSWRGLALLDAATRMVGAVVRSGGLRRGAESGRVLRTFVQQAEASDNPCETIPRAYWSALPLEPDEDGEERVLLQGAVLVRVGGRARPAGEGETPGGEQRQRLAPELLAALEEPPARPGRELLRLLAADGVLAPAVMLAAALMAAAGLVVEALLLRGLLGLGQLAGLPSQRLAIVIAVWLFVLFNLVVQFNLFAAMISFGRRLELRLRMAFLAKIPRLGDRYFQSRLISDMAERMHSVHNLSFLPIIGEELLRWSATLTFTVAGIIWLDPGVAPLALLAGALAVGLPLLAQPLLVGQDLRVRTHNGALSRFYLDSLLGLIPLRVHGAERALRREHESLLVEWAHASQAFYRSSILADGLQTLLSSAAVIWLLLEHLGRNASIGASLLLAYWALNLPMIGQEIARFARQYPSSRNIALRLMEPLGAPEEALLPEPEGASPSTEPAGRGCAIRIDNVTVRASGHTILEQLSLRIEPGSHVAIVGASGAGKSSLVGLLLGWHRPASGQLLVDEEPLGGRLLDQLRRQTVWVDPGVQLWNRSLLDNLRYGAPAQGQAPLATIVQEADLRSVLEKLPQGLQTPLGEGGGLLSGGEGQRVRLGRAMARESARLVILDEPFRGLDRERRAELLRRVRTYWRSATILCVTHDIGETHGFDRVLVIDHGQLVEDGMPVVLLRRPESRYRAMIAAEQALRDELWSSAEWRRLRITGGRLAEQGRQEPGP